MSEGKITRLASAAKELNVGTATIVEHLHAKGFKDVANSPNTKLTEEQYDILLRDFRSDIVAREKAEQINIGKRKEEEITIKEALKEAPKVVVVEKPEVKEEEITAVKHEVEGPKIVGKIDLDKPKKKKEVEEKKEEVKEETPAPKKTTKKEEVVVAEEKVEEKKEEVVEKVEEVKVEVKKSEDFVRAKIETLSGPKILGKIELPIKAERRPEDIYRDEEKAKRDKEREKQKEGRDASQKRARIVQNKVDIKKFEPSKDTRPARP
jgi:translation initiation factor IF-2